MTRDRSGIVLKPRSLFATRPYTQYDGAPKPSTRFIGWGESRERAEIFKTPKVLFRQLFKLLEHVAKKKKQHLRFWNVS